MVASLLGIFALLSTFLPGVFSHSAAVSDAPLFEVQKKAEYAEPADVHLLFVGDIMLARFVERKMNEYGADFPYAYVTELLQKPDLTIGNHEGVVPKTHKLTPPMSFQFSVREQYFKVLKDVGFDMLSLANNHSYDFGQDAFEHTLDICADLDIVCSGDPVHFGKSSIEIRKIDGVRIGFLFLQDVYEAPQVETVTELLTELEKESNIQIVYVHWGEEYALIHNAAQELLAHTLIDSGADAVIGHHPHVVQDVAIYKNKPIFYSLGNFIFDQYFSNEVLSGAGVDMRITDSHITYSVIPFTTKNTHAQPQLMEKGEAQKLFSRMFSPIKDMDVADVEEGVVQLAR